MNRRMSRLAQGMRSLNNYPQTPIFPAPWKRESLGGQSSMCVWIGRAKIMNSKYLLVYRSNVAPSRACNKDGINQSKVLTHTGPMERQDSHSAVWKQTQRNHHHRGLDITEGGTTSNSRQQPLKAKGIKEAEPQHWARQSKWYPMQPQLQGPWEPQFTLHNHPPAHLNAGGTVRP